MTTEDLASWLFGRTSDGVRWGLDRTRELLADVGDPHRRFRSLLIGGTNGKGSVTALCDAALRADPARTGRIGLYTSPHLVSFSERVRIDGTPVADDTLLACAERLRPGIEQTGATFFEATTALAFLCFAEAGIETAVVEVGLGGRLDATNVLEPLATAVTNVSREHTEYLGDSLEGIAREKAGIFRRGVPALTAEMDEAVLRVLRTAAAEVSAPLATVDKLVHLHHVELHSRGAHIELESGLWGRQTLRTPLPGSHQVRNALLAAELLGALPPDIRPPWPALAQGFGGVRWPGRLQREVIRGTTWLFDVAHNPAGAEALATALDDLDLPRPVALVTGILADKDWEAMLRPLLARANACVLTTPPSAPERRRWNPALVAQTLSTPIPLRVIPDFADALDRAATLAPHGTVLVTGSIFTVGDAMRLLQVSV